MLTAAALEAIPDPLPLLVGVLRQHRRGPIAGRPYLAVEAWCPSPSCRGVHAFPWPEDSARTDGVQVFTAPCPGGPYAGGRIAVGLDPGREAEHRRNLADFAARLRRWRSEQRLRHQLAEFRAADRRHRVEGWDVRS